MSKARNIQENFLKNNRFCQVSSVVEEVIVHAAPLILQKRGKRIASQYVTDVTNSPLSTSDYKKGYANQKADAVFLTPQQALLTFVEADLTR